MQPAPSCDLLRMAFETLAVRDHKLHALGFHQAMHHDVWSRVIDCKARAIRAQQQRNASNAAPQLVRRYHLTTDTWRTQRVPGAVDLISP